MALSWFDIKDKVDEAKRTLSYADDMADQMARFLKGRLRHCDGYVLADLKRELRDFNAHTKTWRKDG